MSALWGCLPAWLVVVNESETLLCTAMFVNNELRKVGHKMDGTNALGNLRLDMEADAGGRQPPQSSAVILGSYFQRVNPFITTIREQLSQASCAVLEFLRGFEKPFPT